MTIDTAELRRKAEAELQAARDRYQKTLEMIAEIERVARGGMKTQKQEHESMRVTNQEVEHWSGLRRLILNYARTRTEGFTLQDVVDYVSKNQQTFPSISRKAISTVMSAMYKATKELVVLKEGAGTIPNVYRISKNV